MKLESKIYNIKDFSDFKITKSALTKAFAYAKLVTELFDERLEITLDLSAKDQPQFDGVISDVYCQSDQLVTSDRCSGCDRAYDMEKDGNVRVGWCHSHGMHTPFHSDWDVPKFRRIYQSILSCSNTKTKIQGENGVEDISFAYSLVVNDHFSKPYKEIVMKNHTSGILTHKTDQKEDIPLIVIDDGKEVDYNKLVSDVKSRVTRVDYINFKDGCRGRRSSNKTLSEQELKDIANIIEQKVGEFVKKDVKKVEDIVQEETEKVTEPIEQEIEYSEETRTTSTYMANLEELYDILSKSSDEIYKSIAELSRAYSGKKYWHWDKRHKKGLELLKELKKKSLNQKQKSVLNDISKVISHNKYVKKKHKLIFRDIQRRLDFENSNVYCSAAYLKDRLIYKPLEYKRKSSENALEEIVQKDDPNQVVDKTGLKPIVQTYNKSWFKKAFKKISLYAGLAVLGAALVLIPAKYIPKDTQPVKKDAIVYTVKKGDNLWNLTEDYLKKHNIKIDNGLVYKLVDEVAQDNSQGKQAEYKIGGKEKKNPHYIKPNQKIKFFQRILDYAERGNRK